MSLDRRSRGNALFQPGSHDRYSDVDSHIRMLPTRGANEGACKCGQKSPLVHDYTLERDGLREMRMLALEWFIGNRAVN